MPNLSRLHSHLKHYRINHTAQRDTIYQFIAHNSPCSNLEIIVKMQGQTSKATVYNTIRIFLKLGIIQPVQANHQTQTIIKYELTDRFSPHHHYFHCRMCQKRIGFNDETTEKALTRLTIRRNLALEEHHLELSGLCSVCARQTPAHPAIGTAHARRPD